MDTTTPGRQQHLALLTTDADAPRSWRTAYAALPTWIHRTVAFLSEYWLAGAFLLGALSVLGVMLWLVWALLQAIGSGLDAAADGLGRLGTWFAHGPITHTINDPVRAFLDAHTAGLPATGRDLWITWLAAAVVLYLAALAGSTYARIGWAAIGALSITAAYLGTAAGTGPAVAGLTATVWLLLSLPAYARLRSNPMLDQLAHDLAQRRADRARAAAQEV